MADKTANSNNKFILIGQVLLLILLGLYLVNKLSFDSKAPYQITPISSVKDNDVPKINADFEILSINCPKLFQGAYKNDIESVKYDHSYLNGKCFSYLCEDYSWKEYSEFQVKLKNDLKAVPGDLNAEGHVLHYRVSTTSTNPGIISQKQQSSLICGWGSHADGSDFFKSINVK